MGCIGENVTADIPAVDNDARGVLRRMESKPALQGQECRPDAAVGGDNGGGSGGVLFEQFAVLEIGWRKMLCQVRGSRFIVGIDARLQRLGRNRPVEPPRFEISVPVVAREPAREGSLSRGGGAVDR